MILSPRKLLIRRAHRRVVQRVRSRYQQIKPEPAQGLFNHRCHENSVQYVLTRPEGERSAHVIWEVMMVDGTGEPILHYVVRDGQGRWWEITLGVFASQNEYYALRQISPDDYMHIGSEFNRSIKDWCEEFVGWFGRIVLRIDRCC